MVHQHKGQLVGALDVQKGNLFFSFGVFYLGFRLKRKRINTELFLE